MYPPECRNGSTLTHTHTPQSSPSQALVSEDEPVTCSFPFIYTTPPHLFPVIRFLKLYRDLLFSELKHSLLEGGGREGGVGRREEWGRGREEGEEEGGVKKGEE